MTIADILDNGEIEKTEQCINDHAAMIEKFEASTFTETLTEAQVTNLATTS